MNNLINFFRTKRFVFVAGHTVFKATIAHVKSVKAFIQKNQ